MTRIPVNPLVWLRAMQRWIVGSTVMACAGLATWALRPMAPLASDRSDQLTRLAPFDQVASEAGSGALFDESFVGVRLWNAPPPPPSPPPLAALPPSAPPPTPMRLQLIAILGNPHATNRASLRAAIFDPEHDQLQYVEAGHSIGRWTIRTVSDDGVELSDGETIRRLDISRSDASTIAGGTPR